uniref:Disease resistance N-terminal domain-containing protein n=1 Tax=Ananas comosus var. bracteatus TaxID=296719 RepID=A0A6V7QDE0_ANACO|nr:unnamed protein product [Ananas comosus var. bracteatus]
MPCAPLWEMAYMSTVVVQYLWGSRNDESTDYPSALISETTNCALMSVFYLYKIMTGENQIPEKAERASSNENRVLYWHSGIVLSLVLRVRKERRRALAATATATTTTMSTAITIGGWFASAFLDTLVEKASSYTLQQLGQRSDLHDEVRRLRLSLLKASAVLRRAERKQQQHNKDDEELLRHFLLQLKDAAFDAEDLLGDLDYEVLRRRIAEANEASHDC